MSEDRVSTGSLGRRLHRVARVVAAGSTGLLLATLRVVLRLGRLMLGALLALCEPLLRLTLLPLAYFGVAVTAIFGFVAGDPRFPRWGMLGMSVGALLVYWAFVAVTACVIGRPRGRD